MKLLLNLFFLASLIGFLYAETLRLVEESASENGKHKHPPCTCDNPACCPSSGYVCTDDCPRGNGGFECCPSDAPICCGNDYCCPEGTYCDGDYCTSTYFGIPVRSAAQAKYLALALPEEI